MKILIADYPEPMNRNIDIEIAYLKKELGNDIDVDVWVYNGKTDDLIKHLVGVDALLTAYLEITEEILEKAKDLKFISIEATGYNFVDKDAVQKYKVGVSVIGEYCTEEVADHTLALALAVSRKLKIYQKDIENNHRFDFNVTSGMFRFSAATWGILGFGKIGRAVAKRAQGFGIKVIAYDPYFPENKAKDLGVDLLSLDQVLEKSQIISLHMLLTDENRHILDKQAFSAMKNKPVIVNVSRGGLIDEKALVDALNEGKVFGAGLDVLETESHAETNINPLVGRDDVVITPHTAFYSEFAMNECARISCENIAYYLKGDTQKVFKMVTNF